MKSQNNALPRVSVGGYGHVCTEATPFRSALRNCPCFFFTRNMSLLVVWGGAPSRKAHYVHPLVSKRRNTCGLYGDTYWDV